MHSTDTHPSISPSLVSPPPLRRSEGLQSRVNSSAVQTSVFPISSTCSKMPKTSLTASPLRSVLKNGSELQPLPLQHLPLPLSSKTRPISVSTMRSIKSPTMSPSTNQTTDLALSTSIGQASPPAFRQYSQCLWPWLLSPGAAISAADARGSPVIATQSSSNPSSRDPGRLSALPTTPNPGHTPALLPMARPRFSLTHTLTPSSHSRPRFFRFLY